MPQMIQPLVNLLSFLDFLNWKVKILGERENPRVLLLLPPLRPGGLSNSAWPRQTGGVGNPCAGKPTLMEFLRAAIAAGGAPQSAASGATVLRNGRKFKQLVTSAGKLTEEGRIFEGETGTALEVNDYATGQTPRREGNVELISMRRGQDRVVRKYDTATSKWVYTALGKQFFAQKRVQWIVKVPATFDGKRANGTPYRRTGYFPLNENISIPMAYSQAQRDRKIKAHVLSLYPTGTLAEYSEDQISIRQGAEWHITEMSTIPGAAGAAPQTDVTERPLGALPSVSSLPMPCPLYTSPSPRDRTRSRMPSSA